MSSSITNSIVLVGDILVNENLNQMDFKLNYIKILEITHECKHFNRSSLIVYRPPQRVIAML